MNPVKILLLLFSMLSFMNLEGQTREDYDTWLNSYNKGIDALENQDYPEALKELDLAYSIAQNIFKKQDYDFIDTAYHLGLASSNLGEYKKAITFYKEGLNIFEKNGLDYVSLLEEIGILYRQIGEYEKAIEFNSRCIQILERQNRHESEIYLDYWVNLSQIYINMGEYDKSMLILDDVIPKLELLNPVGEKYFRALFMKGVIYHSKYEYEKEIAFYEKVRFLSNGNLDDDITSSINNNLSTAYEEMGDYENALYYALEVVKKTKETDPNYFIRLQNLAYTYTELGAYEKAFITYQKAKSSCISKYGTKHPLYAKLVDNIGQYYYNKGDFLHAKTYFEEAISVLLKNFDENHSEYGFYMYHYTNTLLRVNEHEKAIDLIKKNIKISESSNNINSQDYFRKQLGLANAFIKRENYNEALIVLKKYTPEVRKKLGNKHSDYGEMLKSMRDAYLGLEEIEKAIPIVDSSNLVQIEQINKVFRFRSETDKKSFLKTLNQDFDEIQSISYSLNKEFGGLNEINLNNQLMLKGLLLNNSKDLLNKLQSLNDVDIEKNLASYRQVKQQLVQNLSLPQEKRRYNLDSLTNILNKKETDLVKLYSENFDDDFELNRSWRESQLKLNTNDVAVEFSHFQYSGDNILTDSIYYVAYVYNKKWEYPKMVKLFEENQLKGILKKRNPNQLYTSRGSKGSRINNGKALYPLIWEPLNEFIKDYKNIYYAPSGLLNQISFAALINTDNECLIKRYNLFQLSSTSILAKKEIQPKLNDALFIGGVDYESKIASNSIINSKNKDRQTIMNNKISRSGTNRSDNWKFLPGTLKEVKSLQSILEANGSEVTKLLGSEANETNFKNLSGNSPNILHIATHGFFNENIEAKTPIKLSIDLRNQYHISEDPLMRSGLVLAGANNALNKSIDYLNFDDGILTAMEISNMNLSSTDIVILSACETGLGDIDGNEGVYGLQRAFKMAGVDIVVMSLWDVPDIETAEFMDLFYRNWTRSNNVKDAFNATQRAMQAKYFAEPEKWAAFVLFE